MTTMAMTTQQSSAVVTRPSDKMGSLKSLFEKKKDAIAAILPKHLTAERIVKVTLSALSRNPELLACSQESIFFAVIQAAELGLEFGGVLGHAYMVPYKNKHTKRLEAVFIPGYRGLIALARRSGQIVSIEAHPVYERDKCVVRFGTNPTLDHEPFLDGDPGQIRLVYAVATLKDGGQQVEVMSLAQVLAIRDRSPAGQSGPWVSDFDEMARKTVVRRLWKYLPMSIEMVKAAEAVDAAAGADGGDFSGITDMMAESIPEVEALEAAPADRPSGDLKAKLAAKAAEGRQAVAEARQPGEEG